MRRGRERKAERWMRDRAGWSDDGPARSFVLTHARNQAKSAGLIHLSTPCDRKSKSDAQVLDRLGVFLSLVFPHQDASSASQGYSPITAPITASSAVCQTDGDSGSAQRDHASQSHAFSYHSNHALMRSIVSRASLFASPPASSKLWLLAIWR